LICVKYQLRTNRLLWLARLAVMQRIAQQPSDRRPFVASPLEALAHAALGWRARNDAAPENISGIVAWYLRIACSRLLTCIFLKALVM
jgi:hypothetical protein